MRLLYCGAGVALILVGASCDGGQRIVTPSASRSAPSAPSAQSAAAFPLTAEMQFGIDEHGSPFPPPDEHDGSGHARDHLYPREVVIGRGGRVTFHIDAVHQGAVYQPGTEPTDIHVNPSTLEDVNLGPFTIPNFRINDPANRIVLGPPQRLFAQEWTTPAGVFAAPSR